MIFPSGTLPEPDVEYLVENSEGQYVPVSELTSAELAAIGDEDPEEMDEATAELKEKRYLESLGIPDEE